MSVLGGPVRGAARAAAGVVPRAPRGHPRAAPQAGQAAPAAPRAAAPHAARQGVFYPTLFLDYTSILF